MYTFHFLYVEARPEKYSYHSDTSTCTVIYCTGVISHSASVAHQAQHLESSKPREMYCPMPIINCVAVVSAKVDNATFM